MQKSAGFVMLLGSILFIGAAFTPAIQKHWFTPYALVPADFKEGWLFGYRMFAAGAMVTAVGFALLGWQLRRLPGDKLIRAASSVADVLVITGAAFWIRSLSENVFPPIRMLIPNGIVLPWITVYVYLSLLSFFIYGYLLNRSGYARWLGFGTLGFNALLVIMLLYLGDLPPAVYYLWPIILGIGLIFTREPLLGANP